MIEVCRNKPAGRTRRRRGAAAVEFGIVAPIMLLAVFGLIEFGRMIMVKQSVTNAAREGCREAALATTLSTSDVDTVVRNHLKAVVPNYSDTSKLRVTCNPDSLSGIASGTPITVDVAVNFSDVSWLPGGFMNLAGNPEIAAESTKERE